MKGYLLAAVAGAVIIGAFLIWIFSLYTDISDLELTVERQKQTLLERETEILKARQEIERVNQAIEAIKADEAQTQAATQAEIERIKKRYEYELEKAKAEIGDNATCEDVLKIIYDSQRGFCYE